MPLPRALKRLEKDQADIGTQVSSLSSTVEQCEKEMSKLKVTLYAKFGSAINLDD
jgi:prefoldin subunit 4